MVAQSNDWRSVRVCKVCAVQNGLTDTGTDQTRTTRQQNSLVISSGGEVDGTTAPCGVNRGLNVSVSVGWMVDSISEGVCMRHNQQRKQENRKHGQLVLRGHFHSCLLHGVSFLTGVV